MIVHTKLAHKFVHHIPETIEPGVLYVSVDFTTAVHRCCCGCGKEVVTPFAPRTGWKLVFDGETVSLEPSIGNRKFECKSHYIILRNRVIDAKPWDDEDDKSAREGDREQDTLGNAEVELSDNSSKSTKGWLGNLEDWVADSRLAKLNRKPTRKKPD